MHPTYPILSESEAQTQQATRIALQKTVDYNATVASYTATPTPTPSPTITPTFTPTAHPTATPTLAPTHSAASEVAIRYGANSQILGPVGEKDSVEASADTPILLIVAGRDGIIPDPATLYLRENTTLNLDTADSEELITILDKNSDLFIRTGSFAARVVEIRMAQNQNVTFSGSTSCLAATYFNPAQPAQVRFLCYGSECVYAAGFNRETMLNGGMYVEIDLAEAQLLTEPAAITYEMASDHYDLIRRLQTDSKVECLHPIIDADQDGVMGYDDQCPAVSGMPSRNGCP